MSLPARPSRGVGPLHALFLLILVLAAVSAGAADKNPEPWTSDDFSGLSWRSIGPAIASGRIGDFAVDPRNPFHYYVGVCSGGVWETHDAGTTFTPVFDDQGSYSIGCLALAPSNPDIVWVGTGESNSQRSVSYGDGIYRSLDGGKSWENMGLKRSLHIGRILVHPTDENIVYVAAEGPLWGPGGDRGVFKTIDGGRTWDKVLDIDENTGVTDIEFDATESLGRCLNAAIETTGAAVVAKIDDDDHYGPGYLDDAVQAMKYAGAPLVGKGATFTYLEGRDETILRRPAIRERFYDGSPTGASLVFERHLWEQVAFPHRTLGEDLAFVRGAKILGVRPYATSPWEFVYHRAIAGNTWDAIDEVFLEGSVPAWVGNHPERADLGRS